jgi:hypothetical protein
MKTMAESQHVKAGRSAFSIQASADHRDCLEIWGVVSVDHSKYGCEIFVQKRLNCPMDSSQPNVVIFILIHDHSVAL